MNKFTKVLSLSLVAAMLMGNTAMATNLDEMNPIVDSVSNEENLLVNPENAVLTEIASEDELAVQSIEGTEDEQAEELVETEEETVEDEETIWFKSTINNRTAIVGSEASVDYTAANEIYELICTGYNCYQADGEAGGPFSITKGRLVYDKSNWWNKGWKDLDVYVVCLSGMDTTTDNQSTGYWTCFLAGFEFNNKYLQNVRATMLEQIPAGSNVIFYGHSLGGMVAQQLSADSTIKDNYNVKNVVTFGSPLIDGLQREGTVKRLGDTSDIVPFLSVSTLLNVVWQSAGLNREDGGYSWGENLEGAHVHSYARPEIWNGYDITGYKTTSASRTYLTLDHSTTQYFKSPTKVTK